jgi:hypothetical protein
VRLLALRELVEPIQVMVEGMVAMARHTYLYLPHFQVLLVVAVVVQGGTVVAVVAPHLMAVSLEAAAAEAVVGLTTDITEITAVA